MIWTEKKDLNMTLHENLNQPTAASFYVSLRWFQFVIDRKLEITQIAKKFNFSCRLLMDFFVYLWKFI